MFSIDTMVREGGYDRLLVRPIHPILQLMFGQFRITVLGDLIGGIAILIAAMSAQGIAWTPSRLLLIIAAIIGGALLDGASLTFRYIESWPARVVFDDIFSRFGNYPLNIFGQLSERLLTFLVPVAFVAWLPVATLLGKPTFMPDWTGGLSVPGGIATFTLAILVFVRASKAYQSSGS